MPDLVSEANGVMGIWGGKVAGSVDEAVEATITDKDDDDESEADVEYWFSEEFENDEQYEDEVDDEEDDEEDTELYEQPRWCCRWLLAFDWLDLASWWTLELELIWFPGVVKSNWYVRGMPSSAALRDNQFIVLTTWKCKRKNTQIYFVSTLKSC